MGVQSVAGSLGRHFLKQEHTKDASVRNYQFIHVHPIYGGPDSNHRDLAGEATATGLGAETAGGG